VDYRRRPGAPLDLSKVKLWGQEPVLWSNEIGEVSYLVRLDAQSRYSFGPDAFEWPSDLWTECEAGDDWQRVETWHADRLWFTGFRNQMPLDVRITNGDAKPWFKYTTDETWLGISMFSTMAYANKQAFVVIKVHHEWVPSGKPRETTQDIYYLRMFCADAKGEMSEKIWDHKDDYTAPLERGR